MNLKSSPIVRATLCLLLSSAAPWLMSSVSAAETKPIRALLVTGGCCHDYAHQKTILTEGISARANVEWIIVHEGGDSTSHKVSIYTNANWSKGFDVVVHDECFADVKDREFVADNYSIADIAIWPWVSRYEWQTVDLNQYPNVKRWYVNIARRPAVAKGYKVPKDVGEVPIPA